MIMNRNVHISVLNGVLWGMEQVHSGICELGQFYEYRRFLMYSNTKDTIHTSFTGKLWGVYRGYFGEIQLCYKLHARAFIGNLEAWGNPYNLKLSHADPNGIWYHLIMDLVSIKKGIHYMGYSIMDPHCHKVCLWATIKFNQYAKKPTRKVPCYMKSYDFSKGCMKLWTPQIMISL